MSEDSPGPNDEAPDEGPRAPMDGDGNAPPWWHAAPSQPPVDSVVVEGLKLAGALRDWAVESGAVTAAAELAQTAATTAATYLSQATEQHVDTEVPDSGTQPAQPVVRCSDCPVCQGLDALERPNPEWAQTARAALSQVTAVMHGLIGQAGEPPADPDL